MRALPENCKLLLLGDQFQLPSVDAGAVLADLMPAIDSKPWFTAKFADAVKREFPDNMDKFTSETRDEAAASMLVPEGGETDMMTDHVTVLEVSKRFQKEIAELSGHVRNMESAKVAEFLSARTFASSDKIKWDEVEGVRLIPSNCDWNKIVSSWIAENLLHCENSTSYAELVRAAEKALDKDEFGLNDASVEPLRDLFARIAASRVLCLTHEGKFGVSSLNARIAGIVASDLKENVHDDMFAGVFVMVLENSRRVNLYNGDIGVLLRHAPSGQLRAVFENGNHFIAHALHAIPAHRPAFAMTIHKSQGSEFERVLMPLPENTNHRLLTREIIYTGLTRAKKA
ncbi:MAG: ATP-binding domain-containing protein, partial [Victivallales bacterium]|nr:ATP-binding domain-containing protein [Victivallales bacterium]